MSTFVDELTPDMAGTYVVRTQGSEHTWNLDEGTYTKRQIRANSHPSMMGFPTGIPLRWREVDRWPNVGETFLISLDHPDWSWHQSSRIREIERVES